MVRSEAKYASLLTFYFFTSYIDISILQSMRLTKIVCTLGPASDSPKQLRALAELGLDVARINLSHGSRETQLEKINILRALNDEGFNIAIMLDTQGCEIRTGTVQDPFIIKKGEEIIFSPRPVPSEQRQNIEVSYDAFANDVKETDRIIIDNGELTFDIVSVEDDSWVIAKAREDGEIGSRRHINLPGADIDLPSITDKDWEDIAYAAEQNVDYVALSFIRSAEEVESVRQFFDDKDSDVQIISKIEAKKGVENIDDIIEASDGIMIARGDLGAEMPFEQLPVIQDHIVTRCIDGAKPVIIATHMLESMIEHPIPTRAEITDVAHAARTQVDAAMLSGESAIGKHPLTAVDAMIKILMATEEYIARFTVEPHIAVHGEREAQAEAATSLSSTADADAIVVFTRTGQTARLVSKFRPFVPIIAFTPSDSVKRRLALLYGVHAHQLEFNGPEETVSRAIDAGKMAGILKPEMDVVFISDTQTKEAPVSSVQIRTIT